MRKLEKKFHNWKVMSDEVWKNEKKGGWKR